MALLRIGEVARQSGISSATVRLYERRGLLAPAIRSASGYRGFPQEAVERMKLVQCSLAVGFTLNELSRILRERDSGKAPCRAVRLLAQEKLAELKTQKNEIARLCRLLTATLREWDKTLTKTPRGKQARLLDSLASGSAWLAEMKSPHLHARLNRKKGRNP